MLCNQVIKKKKVTNVHFSRYLPQLCAPGREAALLCERSRTEKKNQEDTINAMLTLRQSFRQTSDSLVEEAMDREGSGGPVFPSRP